MKINKTTVLIAISVIFILVFLPVDINEIHITNTGSALWNASDFLSYYGALLSFIGATVLGLVALKQSVLANSLSERMLKLEESKDIPIIDLYTCKTSVDKLPHNALGNSYKLSLNDSYILFNEDNSINQSSGMVSLFEIKNISSTDIISLKIVNVTQKTIFANEEEFETTLKFFETNAAISVLAGKESLLLTIVGTEMHGPQNMSIDERFEKNYLTPALQLELTFSMKNYKGNEFEETVKFSYYESTNINDIDYPIITNKDIVSVERVKKI